MTRIKVMGHDLQAKIGQFREARGLLGEISPQPTGVLSDDHIKLAATSRRYKRSYAGELPDAALLAFAE
jgi:hypothetical protein